MCGNGSASSFVAVGNAVGTWLDDPLEIDMTFVIPHISRLSYNLLATFTGRIPWVLRVALNP